MRFSIWTLPLLCFFSLIGSYTSAQGSWQTLVNDSKPIFRQTSILLDDGNVVTGTHQYFGEIYYTSNDSIYEFFSHGGVESAVVKLHNGLVLYSGWLNAGGKSYDTLSLISLYNPATNVLSRNILHHESKGAHTATLLKNNKVLLAGGVRDVGIIAITNDPYIKDTLWYNGRKPEVFKVYASCDYFDPVDSSLTATAPLQTARVRHKAILLNNGQVLVVGGRDKDSRTLKSCELFDPIQESWTLTDPLPNGLSRFQLVKLPGGDILLSGGFGTLGASDICLRYDANAHNWQTMAPMHHKRYNHSMTLLNSGKILVVGGANDKVLKSVELYDPATDSWSIESNLSYEREEHTATLLNSGKVLIVGGLKDVQEVRKMEVYTE